MEIIMRGKWGTDTPWIGDERQRAAFIINLGEITRRRLELRREDIVRVELEDPLDGVITRRRL